MGILHALFVTGDRGGRAGERAGQCIQQARKLAMQGERGGPRSRCAASSDIRGHGGEGEHVECVVHRALLVVVRDQSVSLILIGIYIIL